MDLLGLYTDYLIASSSHTPATRLSEATGGLVSHDKISRMLREAEFDSKTLWKKVKPLLRQFANLEGVLIVDDTIAEKEYTDENDIICWHYDHSKQRNVKGINFVTLLFAAEEVSLPIGYELVKKTIEYVDEKNGKMRRKADRTKNEIFRDLVKVALKNNVNFSCVLADIWYGSAENMCFLKQEIKKDFIIPLKSNRKVALCKADRDSGRWQVLENVELKRNETRTIYLEGVPFPLLLAKQVFKNEDQSEGVLYLTSSDTKSSYDQTTTIYQKRWKVEEFHKSLKSNASLEKSPTKTVRTQSNHLFASFCAFVKLEKARLITSKNHFRLKAEVLLPALKVAIGQVVNLPQFA